MASQANAVGFVGFDEISLELADSLVCSGYAVQAFDPKLDGPLEAEFLERLGGIRCASVMEATRVVVNNVFYGTAMSCIQ
ncbi:RAB6A-GEF complex partner protein 1 [Bienertia sinuspersici]